MNNKFLSFVAVVILLLGGAIGWIAKPASKDLSGTVNYSNSLSQSTLYTTLESLLADINDLRVIQPSSTVTVNLPNLTGSATGTTPMTASTTALTGVALGDIVSVSISTTTTAGSAQSILFHAQGCAVGTVCWTAWNASTTAIDLGPETFLFKVQGVLPAIHTVSSTSN